MSAKLEHSERPIKTGRIYLTTAIPYVNGEPHIGHALELVQVDALARAWRARGHEVRTQTGTDDNALKNVRAAEAAGVAVADFVRANGDEFVALLDPLSVDVDDVIRTASDPRHRHGVERLWRACADQGDLYLRDYEGAYCVGCEAFLDDDDLDASGQCTEHRTPPDVVRERNWFFRLSRYGERITNAIENGALRIEPAARRNEVLAQLRSGLHDISVSRSIERAHGWGIPVPGDPSQVVYVWFDALANYVTALGDGGDEERWWNGADERIHLIGKGIIRFHALYWPAILASAGLPLPTALFVHDYLTVDGAKISKSIGNGVAPAELVDRFGTDAVRWWLLTESPVGVDADFTVERLVRRANEDLANGLGNLVTRTVALVHRLRGGRIAAVPAPTGEDGRVVDDELDDDEFARALEAYDLRGATRRIRELISAANTELERVRPWELAKTNPNDERIDEVLADVVIRCRRLITLVRPFVPATAEVAARCIGTGATVGDPGRVFDRLDLP
jgi:methionyl-tRNA synthetase